MPAPDPASLHPEDPAPVTGETLRGDDWYGRDLTGLAYTACDFYDTDWTETTGSGARFDRCTFSGVRFNVSHLTATAFTHCEFRRCSFFDARLDQCKAVGSTFDACSFRLLKVIGGDWSFTSFPRADLRKAVLDGVRMREADLRGARLDEAEVTGTDLSGALLAGVSLTGADLRGSDLSALDAHTLDRTALAGARIDPAQAVGIAVAMGFEVA
ncbi:pentapeptide repeat-containing protein [Streptomyces albidoflavus]|uniref:pentapeptide repeat-containing protein n=1 Tax=Streptomyces albidoflavus TaxID=1886 RepID=UPI00101E6735|nr:pentapeptide repeat-containing protein [Streptomyces albidoflavus]RZD81219.1 hypothetical protein C0Q60_12795 [Streptomyces albidoflavus]RZD87739.1 hypothetical protein C0Q63_12160 [Streptomyces albidoflavus]RZD99215.1 hypothetical protein C0Q62_12680 [Streptomyces albidoflavus]